MNGNTTYNPINISYREIQIIFDSTSVRGAQRKLTKIRKHFKKERRQLLTITEISTYTGVPISELDKQITGETNDVVS